MNNNLNWNRERWRTRDRLINYDNTLSLPYPKVKNNNEVKENGEYNDETRPAG